MPSIMETNCRQSSPFECLGEIEIHKPCINRSAISLGEHKPMVLIPWPQQQFLFSLLRFMASQCSQTYVWDRDGTTGFLGLWLLEVQTCFPSLPCGVTVVDAHEDLTHLHNTNVQINVLPPETKQLPTPQAHHKNCEE